MAHIIAQQVGAVDPIGTYSVKHTTVDFRTTAWSYENCKMVFDHPHTVRTLDLRKPCYMYAMLKFTPGLYLCRVNSVSHQPNCKLELLERASDESRAVQRRNGCMCHSVADLRVLLAVDTNVELRVTFTTQVDRRVPSFGSMEVRVKQHICMPLRVAKVCGGSSKKHVVRYDLPDMQFILKKVLYGIHWLESLEADVDALIQLVTNPLWDVREPSSAHEYAHLVQEIQSAIVDRLPLTFVTGSFRYTVQVFNRDMRFPLISQTLVTELARCVRTDTLDQEAIAAVLRQSLRYINFMLVEFAEFKQQLTTTITSLGPAEERTSTVVIAV
jgi:hypothetical protein